MVIWALVNQTELLVVCPSLRRFCRGCAEAPHTPLDFVYLSDGRGSRTAWAEPWGPLWNWQCKSKGRPGYLLYLSRHIRLDQLEEGKPSQVTRVFSVNHFILKYSPISEELGCSSM